MSSINPNNINGQYPIAGQDNDSQGFRDNFTNIKNNLTFAKSEIEAIEQRAILKTAIPGIPLNNEMNNGQIKGAQLLRATETIKDLVEVGTTVDWSEGHFQYFTLSENTILSLTGWPTSGFYTKLRLQVNVTNIAYTLTLPTAVPLDNANSIQGCTAGVITFPAIGTYLFEFSTYDSGITVTVQDLLRNYEGGVSSFIDITVSATANITGNTASISTTTGALTVAGGAGVDGNVNVGGAADIDGNLNVGGAAGVAGNLNVSGDVVINGNIIQNGVTIQNGILNYNEYQVTVADNGSGTQTVFHLDGTALVSNSGATFGLKFVPGNTYKFDLSDSSNALVPLKFSTTPDTEVPVSITSYTTGVSNSIILAGNAGAYVQITITNETPSPLYLYADDIDTVIDTSLIGGALPITVGVDALAADNILAGNITATGSVGFATGAGNTVVQGTSKSTSVEANGATGTITLHNANLNGNSSIVSFTFTNSSISSTDLVLLQHQSGGTLGAYTFTATPGSGSAVVYVTNVAHVNLGEAPVVRFAVIKSVNS